MKEAILITSFGTTHQDTLEKNITAVENDVRAAFPGIECRRAFTSGIVRKRLKEKYGVETDSVGEALERLAADGYSHVIVQPTLLIPGEEYDLLREGVFSHAGDLTVSIGFPLLWDDRDISTLAEILTSSYPVDDDTVLVAMGHGTSHSADLIYDRLAKTLEGKKTEICTVEGSRDFKQTVSKLCRGPYRKAHLVPLLLVAGDHSKNDMASGSPDSLRGMLEAEGFTVTFSLKGLGEIPAVRQLYIDRIRSIKG
ncbi:MAG: sirohydrochlorin cobaltochelatase [Oscillospiraceae bacterium]|nr:sirohydrochlorin cobaltochelatase [Oscillospiraceae bacterium]